MRDPHPNLLVFRGLTLTGAWSEGCGEEEEPFLNGQMCCDCTHPSSLPLVLCGLVTCASREAALVLHHLRLFQVHLMECNKV